MTCNSASPVPFRRIGPWFVLPVCLFLCALPARLFAQTVAFSGVVRTLGSGFSDPAGVAVDASGDVFVADEINNAVYEVLAVGGSIPASPTIRTLSSGFNTPTGVAVDSSGNVYVADAGNNAVKEMLAVGGSVPNSPTIRTLGSGFSRPTGVAVDSNGNVYVADFDNGIAKEILAVGGSIPTAPSIRNLVTGFAGPMGVAVDGSGNVYVAAYEENRVWRIVAVDGVIPASTSIIELGTGFNEPASVAVDGSGNVYVSDVGDNAVYEIVAVGGIVPASPTIKTLGGGFSGPDGVTVDASGSVYIADTFNSAVKEIVASGTNFGTVSLASTSLDLPLQFRFNSAGTGVRVEVLTEGAPGLDFADTGTGSCTTNATSHAYNAGDICSVDVTFRPRFAGLRRGAVLVINPENGDELASVPIYGIGIGPQIGFISGAQTVVGGNFDGTIGVAVDGAGDVFIGDALRGLVLEAPADGGPQTIVADGLDRPWEIAVDGAGDVLIADSLDARVLKVSSRGGGTSTVGTLLSQPFGVAVDGAGNVFIADYTDNDVVEVPANGSAQTTVASGLNQPMGIAVDDAGNLFVANQGGKVVDEVVPGNTMPLLWVSGLGDPQGVAVDAAGDVFVGDRDATSIVELPFGGVAHTLLDNNGLNAPGGVAVDGAGDLFVADSNNFRVVELPYSQPPSLTFSTGGGAQTVTLENIGNLPLALPGMEQGTNPVLSNSSFVLDTTAPTACAVVTASASTSGTLAPGHTCDLIVTFLPTNGGTQSGTMVLTDNSLNASPTGFSSQTFPLSGTANANLPDITWVIPGPIGYGTALSATQLNAAANVAGSFSYNPAAGAVPGVGTHTLSVTFTPTNTASYTTATTTVTLTVNKAVPAITWATPAAITYGTVLSATQLDATSPVAGQFVYTPPAGTGLTAGSQALSVTFTPTDSSDYQTATASTTLTVNKASQTINFTQPASSVYYGISPITLSATGGASGNPVTFGIQSGPGSLSGTNHSVLTVTGPGTIVIAANQAGATNYAAAPQVTRSITVVTGTPSTLTAPTPGSLLTGASVKFTWTSGTGVTQYDLHLSDVAPGDYDLYVSGRITSLSATVSGLPTNGKTIYARLYSVIDGVMLYNDYTYATGSLAQLISPAPSTPLTATTQLFKWTTGTGASQYDLHLSAVAPGGYDLYVSGRITSTSTNVHGLPTNGETIYARLYSVIDGTMFYDDYTYTAK